MRSVVDSVVPRAADVQRQTTRNHLGVNATQPSAQPQQPATQRPVPVEQRRPRPLRRHRRPPPDRHIAGQGGRVAVQCPPVPLRRTCGTRPSAHWSNPIFHPVELRSDNYCQWCSVVSPGIVFSQSVCVCMFVCPHKNCKLDTNIQVFYVEQQKWLNLGGIWPRVLTLKAKADEARSFSLPSDSLLCFVISVASSGGSRRVAKGRSACHSLLALMTNASRSLLTPLASVPLRFFKVVCRLFFIFSSRRLSQLYPYYRWNSYLQVCYDADWRRAK